MKFTEEKLEQAFTKLLGLEGYPHFHGDAIVHAEDEVLIEADLIRFLQTQYRNEGITLTEIKSIILQLKTYSSSDLYESNKAIMSMVSEGFVLKREDRNSKYIYIQFIDYSGLDKQKSANEEVLIHVVANKEPEYGERTDNNIYKFVKSIRNSWLRKADSRRNSLC